MSQQVAPNQVFVGKVQAFEAQLGINYAAYMASTWVEKLKAFLRWVYQTDDANAETFARQDYIYDPLRNYFQERG